MYGVVEKNCEILLVTLLSALGLRFIVNDLSVLVDRSALPRTSEFVKVVSRDLFQEHESVLVAESF